MPEESFERTLDAPCPVCGERRPTDRIEIADHQSPAVFHASRCGACGTTYVDDPPTAECLGSFYDTDSGAAMHKPPGRFFTAARRVRIRSDLKPLLSRLGPGEGVADIGTGDGSTARYVHSLGLPAVGVDIYPESEWQADDVAYRSLDLARGESPRDLSEAAGGPVRGAVMRHVLEHVLEPVTTLRGLKEAGITQVLVIVPNIDSRMVKRAGANWYYWDPPRHLTFFNRHTLGLAAERAGMSLTWSRTYGIDEIVTSAHRKALLAHRDDLVTRVLRPTGVLAGLASVAQAPIGNGVLQGIVSA